MKRGIFISLEGIDGCGKSTQAKEISNFLSCNGIQNIITREPGGTKISESIRDVLLNNKNQNMSKYTEVWLFMAARSQIIYEVIEPNLKNGIWIICDRFLDSTVAYQSFGRGIDINFINKINKMTIGNTYPNITFLFDLDLEESLRRATKGGISGDRIESEKKEFFEKVIKGYNYIVEHNVNRVREININGLNSDSVYEKLLPYLLSLRNEWKT